MCKVHEEFLDWASRYDVGGIAGKTLARHEAYWKDQHCPVWEFRGELALEHLLQKVLQSVREMTT